ncbi:CoA-binding protein [Helicobacter sp.]|uniref:CoA-binding protein n=1 Tax=Helicobacter sp. TaxID=218 RepID=UPI00199C5201|nr:CoA-binding protein [Helicobacter sp.]MBD5164827.1 CoA-binding protein [Helicobacter sp.]
MQDLQDSKLQAILKQSKVIAVLGLSPEANKPSHRVAQFLQDKGYKILPIYPRGGEILGEKAYQSLQEAFEAQRQAGVSIDILNVFRKSEALPQVAREVLELKNPPQCVWVQLGLENAQAKEMLNNVKILYVENLCIKLEYERLL